MNLKRLEVEIIDAADGAEALKAVARMLPHLVITDIKIQVMDGPEPLQQLKSRPEMKGVPVIVVSGEFGMEVRDTIFKMGAEDFTTKEIEIDDFIPRVRRFTG